MVTRNTARTAVDRIVLGAAAGALAGATAAVIDCGFTAWRGAWAGGVPVVAVGMLGLLGAISGAILLPLCRGLAARWRALGLPTLDAAATVALVGAVVLIAVGTIAAGVPVFTERTPPSHLHTFAWLLLGVMAVAAVAAWALAWLCRRGTATMVLAVTVSLAAAIALAVHVRSVAEGLDLRFVAVAAAGLLALPVVGARPWRRGPARAVVLAGFALFGAALVVLATSLSVRVVIARYSPTVGAVARQLARVLDVDGDGHSFVDAEDDCAPFDPAIHPFAIDVPEDGIDQDCHGGDLTWAMVGPALGTSAAVPAVRPRPNVLLVTIETLRADHVGLYGYARDTTPELDARFADAVIFDRAYTVAPVTDRVMPAILTAAYPSRLVESLDYATHVLGDARVLLTERLHDAGYRTVVLHSFHFFDDHGLGQGIDDLVILHDVGAMGAHATTRLATARMREHARERRGQPLFLWVHYYEPHARHTPPAQHRLWDGGGDIDDEAPIDLYDAEIHFVDHEVDRLFAAAEHLGLTEDAWTIVSSDHGEEFLEHGRRMHAFAVYEESIRVPLLVRGPGAVPRRIPEPVSLIDLTPTLLELLDIPFVAGADGRSRAAEIRGGEVATRPVVVEQYRHGSDELQKLAAIDGTDKLILDLEHSLWELYDLAADPAERDNVYGRGASRGASRAAAMRTLLLDHLARARAVRLPGAP